MQQHRTGGFIRGLVAIGLLTGALSLADSTQAANSKGQYYATPSWNQKLPADTRFVVLTDWNSEAVLDRETGLVWEKSPDATDLPWRDSTSVCINKNVGGRAGWRLPAIAELASLIDRSVAPPGLSLPLGHPFTTSSSPTYWSATTLAESPTNAWFVNFFNGFVIDNFKFERLHAWCVRGGMNADVY